MNMVPGFLFLNQFTENFISPFHAKEKFQAPQE